MRFDDSRSAAALSSAARSLVVSAVCVLGSLATAPVSAQEAIMATLSSFGDRTSPDLAQLGSLTSQPVSQAECDAGAVAEFRFSGVDQTRAQLHLFHGTNCEMASVRNDTTDMSCTDLMLEYAIEMNTQIDQPIPISSLIDCTGSSGSRNIYVLALDNETSEVTGAGQQVVFPIAFDFEGPSAPTELIARAGQTNMTLSWTASMSETASYEVFFVPNGCDATGAVTADAMTRLTASPPDAADKLSGTIPGSSASGSIAFPDGVSIGQWNAVAVRGIDTTGNEGGLSNIACVQRISITTWFDTYCSGSSPPASCNSAGCAAAPERGPAKRGMGLALLFLGAFVWRARR